MNMMNLPEERVYNDAFAEKGNENVVLIDVIEISKNQKIELRFEQVDSQWKQGVWLKTDKYILVDGQECPSVRIWEEAAPDKILLECYSENGLLWLYNIWDKGDGCESQSWTSGMLVQENGNCRRYCCNDIGFETDFHKLVFQILIK